MAITGHKNQQSLTDYDELDNDDHIRLGKILSYDKYEENTHVQYSMTHNPRYNIQLVPLLFLTYKNVMLQ